MNPHSFSDVSSDWDGAQFRQLLDTLPACAYVCNRDGLITYFNEQAAKLFGRAFILNDPADRYCGCVSLFTAGGTPLAQEQSWMALAMETGCDHPPCEIEIERPDGSRIAVIAHATPIRDASGTVVGALNVLVDITGRKRDEEANALHSAIVQSSEDAIFSKSLDGRILSWNSGAQRLFQFTPEEIIGRTITSLIPAERLAEEQSILNKIRQGERIESFETVRLAKSGKRIEVSVTISPVSDRQGVIRGASTVARDITARKQAERALQESEQRFARFMQYLPGLAWIKDGDGRYLFVNEAASRAFQKTRAELYGKRDDELFPKQIAEQLQENDRKAISSESGLETVESIRQADGVHHSLVSKFPIPAIDGGKTLVGGMAIDITQRLLAEQALLALKNELADQLADLSLLHDLSVRLATTPELQPVLDETLRAAVTLQDTDMGIISLCDETQRVLHVRASIGFDAEFLAALDPIESGMGASGKCLSELRRIVVEDTETDPIYADFRELARRAGYRAIHNTPLTTRSGKVIGVLSTHFRSPRRPTDREIHLIDLCCRQAADFIENARLYEELREADRRKDEFLAMLAHELRNPLAPISHSLQILRMTDDLPPAIERVRDIMDRQVTQMVRLVNDLLDVSRITRDKIKLQIEPVELSKVVADAVETSRPLVEESGHQLAISLPAEPLLVEADALRLEQVVANLLNNAAKYTSHTGQIWLSVRREGNEAVLSVRDNGLGIAADMLHRVFEPFSQMNHTLPRSQGGLGIGLTLAKRLVEMHGGRIAAHSEGPDKGSEFIVHLPLAAKPSRATTDRPESAKPPAKQPSAPKKPTYRILVVDDQRDSAFVLGKLLGAMGHDVRTASSAVEGLAAAKEHQPHIVISDIGMPDVDGFEFARRLRPLPEGEKVALVALTGFGQENDRQRTMEAGFDYHLVKPASLEALERLLESISARHGELLAEAGN